MTILEFYYLSMIESSLEFFYLPTERTLFTLSFIVNHYHFIYSCFSGAIVQTKGRKKTAGGMFYKFKIIQAQLEAIYFHFHRLKNTTVRRKMTEKI